MKRSSVVNIISKMIDGTDLKMQSVETNSRQEFYHQGALDALKIALEMVKDIDDSESSILDSDRINDAV